MSPKGVWWQAGFPLSQRSFLFIIKFTADWRIVSLTSGAWSNYSGSSLAWRSHWIYNNLTEYIITNQLDFWQEPFLRSREERIWFWEKMPQDKGVCGCEGRALPIDRDWRILFEAAPLHLTLSDLKRSKSRSLRFWRLRTRKRVEYLYN